MREDLRKLQEFIGLYLVIYLERRRQETQGEHRLMGPQNPR